MLASWVVEETESINLGDQRLNRRAADLLSALSAGPTLSIPAACGGHGETQAAYRFFDNDQVGFSNVLEPHIHQSGKRIASIGADPAQRHVVLLAQDTTEIDLTRPQQVVRGAGMLDRSRRGVLLHLVHAFTPEGTPLGTVYAECIIRASGTVARKHRNLRPVEEKESMRWLRGLRACEELAGQIPSMQFVGVADSDADLYQWLAESCKKPAVTERCQTGSRTLKIDWVVRASSDRRLAGEADEEPCGKLRERLHGAAVLYQAQVVVRGREAKTSCETRARRKSRDGRAATVSVRAAAVVLEPPKKLPGRPPAVPVNAVLVHEDNPPGGQDPIDWLLLTTLPIDSAEQVRQIVEYYCARWNIEILFRTLKSGCRIEQRRFEDVDRILPCIAMYLIVAWRTLLVCRMGRECSQVDCQAIFEPCEWRAVWMAVRRSKPPKKTRPRLGEIVDMIATLGGYIKRPGSRPGPQTMWIGMQRAYDLAWAWSAFGPESEAKKT